MPIRELRVEDALMYLDQVKLEFGDRPQIYNDFLEIMKNFKSMKIDTPGVIRRVSTLFQGNKALVLGFNTFLPEGFKIEIPVDGSGAFFRTPGEPGVTYINLPNESNRSNNYAQEEDVQMSAAMNGDQQLQPQPHQQQQMHGIMRQNQFQQQQPISHAKGQGQNQLPPQQGLNHNESLGGPGGPNGHGFQQQQQFVQQQRNMQMQGGQPQDMQVQPAGRSLFQSQQQQPVQFQGKFMNQQEMKGGSHTPPNVMHGVNGANNTMGGVGGPHQHFSHHQQQQQQPPPQQQQPPVEFDHAINYVTTIKKRFASAPDTYKKFLEILHTYQKEQRGIKEVLDEVSVLFAEHPDLLKDFTYFLPDAVQEQAKIQLHDAVKAAEIRKKALDQQRAILEQQQLANRKRNLAAQVQMQDKNTAIQDVDMSPPQSVNAVIKQPQQQQQPQQPDPSLYESPTVPFGAAVGRTEEREREICRSSIYGFVSFEPQRPPRKHTLSPSQVAAKFGRPRSIPEQNVQPTTKEATFFEKVRFHLNRKELGPDKPPGSRRHTPHAEFLKLLHLFGAGIISKEELLLLIRSLFTQGHAPRSGSGGANNPQVVQAANLLVKEFEELMISRGPYAQQEMSKKGKSKYGAVTSKEFELSLCTRYTPSYISYPTGYNYDTFHSFSGQSEGDASVLNTKVLCVGRDRSESKRRLWNSPEDYDGIRERRNIYEEAMAKVEDERFEVDMAIERNGSALRQVEPLAEEVSMLRETEERDSQPIGRLNYKLRPKSLLSNHVGAIARLYGDRGDEVLQYLLRNPVAVLPIIFKRLREKDSEWRRVRTEMSKQWRVVAETNFDASLDVLCYFNRREIEHSFRTANMIENCERARHYCKHPKEIHVATEAVAPSFSLQHSDKSMILFQPYLSVKVANSMPHKEVYELVSLQIQSAAAKTNSDKEKTSRFWTEFIASWFDLPLHWFMNEMQGKSRSEKSSIIVRYAPGQMVKTAYGEGCVLAVIDGGSEASLRYKVKLPYGIGYIRPKSVAYHLPSDLGCIRSGGYMDVLHDDSMDTSDAKTLKSDCHCIFATEKLYLFMRLYCGLVALVDKVKTHLNEKSLETSQCRKHLRLNTTTKNCYKIMLSSLKDYLNEDIEFKKYELICREMSKDRVYQMSALPRLVEKCADALVKVCREDMALMLFDLSRLKPKDVVQQRNRSLKIADALYRIQYDSSEDSIHFSYLGRDKHLSTVPRIPSAMSQVSGTSEGKATDESFEQNGEKPSESAAKRMKLK